MLQQNYACSVNLYEAASKKQCIVNPLDVAAFRFQNPHSNANLDFTPLLGRQAVEQSGLIKLNHDNFVNSLWLSNIFDKYNIVFNVKLGRMRA